MYNDNEDNQSDNRGRQNTNDKDRTNRRGKTNRYDNTHVDGKCNLRSGLRLLKKYYGLNPFC